MKMARVILFTAQMDAMSEFYGRVPGLKQVTNEKDWKEFAAGVATIALHSGPSSPGRKGAEDCVLHKGRCCSTRNACGAGRKVREGPPGRSVLSLRWQGPGWKSRSIVGSLKLIQLCFGNWYTEPASHDFRDF